MNGKTFGRAAERHCPGDIAGKRPYDDVSPADIADGFASPDEDTPHVHSAHSPQLSSSKTMSLGPRKRKKTRIFEIAGPSPVRKTYASTIGVAGKGVKLSTIPNIMYALDKCKPKDPEVEFLHRLLFNSAGQSMKRKTNIRSFSGFVFRSEKDGRKVREKLMKCHLNMIKKIGHLLDVSLREAKKSKTGNLRTQGAEENGNRGERDENISSALMRVNAEIGLDEDSPQNREDNFSAEGAIQRNISTSPPSLDTTTATGDEKRTLGVRNGVTDGMNGDTRIQGCLKSSTPEKVSRKNGYVPCITRAVRDGDSALSRIQKETSTRIARETAVNAIMEFLAEPRVLEGRVNIAENEKLLRKQKKALEKAKAQKAALKKAAEKKKLAEKKKRAMRESDEDGNEDLETGGTPWITWAQQWKEDNNSHTAASAHG